MTSHARVDADVDPPAADTDLHAVPAPGRRRLRWWKEVLYILAFYLVYTAIRNTQGSASVNVGHALDNAKQVIAWERHLGLFHEQGVQHAFLGSRGFIEFWNLFYGTFHFIVTAFALVFVFRRFPERYARWRNTLACTTGLALVGFALYPLMPPRLLNDFGEFGGRLVQYSFHDTLHEFGSLWSFDSGTMQKLSNQYAAMPSLHFAWSTWCALVLVPSLRRPWTKALALAYPLATLFAIVVTGNHYVLDAAGGAVVLGAGYLLGYAVTNRVWRRQRPSLIRLDA